MPTRTSIVEQGSLTSSSRIEPETLHKNEFAKTMQLAVESLVQSYSNFLAEKNRNRKYHPSDLLIDMREWMQTSDMHSDFTPHYEHMIQTIETHLRSLQRTDDTFDVEIQRDEVIIWVQLLLERCEPLFAKVQKSISRGQKEGEEKDPALELERVRWNQELTLYFYLAGQHEKGSLEYQEASLFGTLLHLVGNTGFKQQEPEARSISAQENGARAQAGVMRCLEAQGYLVLGLDPQDEEDMQWDLMGIDCIAISPNGDIFLIDVKADRFVMAQDGITKDLAYEQIRVGTTLIQREWQPELEAVVQKVKSPFKQIPDKNLRDEAGELSEYGKLVTALLSSNKLGTAKHVEIRIPSDLTYLSAVGEMAEDQQKTLMEKLQFEATRPRRKPGENYYAQTT